MCWGMPHFSLRMPVVQAIMEHPLVLAECLWWRVNGHGAMHIDCSQCHESDR